MIGCGLGVTRRSAPDGQPAGGARSGGLSIAAANLARWSSVINLPLVPTAAANLPDGRVLLWSADDRFNFGTDAGGQTYTVIFDPGTGAVTERLVSETGHDMFCPGTANLADGRILVNGGLSSGRTSIFDPASGAWTRAADMNIPRGYEGTTPLADGSVFTLGGSWAGGVGDKHGEVWTAAAGWRRLSGVLVDAFLSDDTTRVFGMDSHLWLLPMGNGRVLHAGPGVQMHWIDTAGDGRVSALGPRGDDEFSINGNAVMYDLGKVLKVGGAPGYEGMVANANAYVIEVGATVEVRKIQPMAFQRAFDNQVVLPNGQVVVVGGATIAAGFSDSNSVLAPELFEPSTETFAVLPPMNVPRNYHSVALLLPDGRVLSSGGGLCGATCAANHADLQILSPPYLFNSDGSAATRPVIQSAPTSASHGTAITVTTDGPIAGFALLRSSSSTHALNNDQRRLPLPFRSTGSNVYAVEIPSNPGWAVPGLYMLFAINDGGVPSVALNLRVGADTPLRLAPVADQSSAVGAQVGLTLVGASPGGAALSYAASGLPPGVAVDATTGAVSGAPSAAGSYLVEARVSDGAQTTSTQFAWLVQKGADAAADADAPAPPDAGGTAVDGGAPDRGVGADAGGDSGTVGGGVGAITARLVRLQADSEVNGGPWTSAAEINLLDEQGQPLPRAAWSVTADSAEVVAEGGGAANAIDGNPASFWHTQWSPSSPPPPHWIQLDLGGSFRVSGLRYLPRQDAPVNGTIARYRVTVSADGVTWSDPVAQGDLTALGPPKSEKTITFTGVDLAPPVLAAIAAPIAPTGSVVSYAASATGGGPVQYQWNFGDGSGDGPFGDQGTASHQFASPGVYTVTVVARNVQGASSVRRFLQGIAGPTAVAGTARASGNLTLTPRAGQGDLIWVVNLDNDSVSVFDAAGNGKLAEIAVGNRPRAIAAAPDGRVWVSNQGASTLSIIDPASFAVVRTVALARGSQPFGVVIGDDGIPFVALEATGQLVKLDGTGAVVATLDVGANPRHLALTPGGDPVGQRLLVPRFITPRQPGEETAAVQTSVGGVKQGGQVLLVDPAALAQLGTITLQHSDRPDSTVSGRGVPNYLGAPAISPDGQSAWVPSKQDNIQRGLLRDQRELDFQNTVRAISSRIDLVAGAEDYPARLDHDNAGLASAAVYDRSGVYLLTALETSRQIAVVDARGQRELFRADTGLAPQALAVSADGRTLYLHNALDRSVGVYDLRPLVERGEATLPLTATLPSVAVEKLVPQVLRGKQLFYDARDTRLARDGYLSCAACHDDGGHDGRTWDLTGLGEGLRNTISLRGRAGGQGRLHWSANFDEVQDFEGQIRALSAGIGLMSDADFAAGTRSQPLGDAKAGRSADLDALAAYLGSLSAFAPSPYRDSSGALTGGAVAGRVVFAAACAACHRGDAFTDSDMLVPHDVGTIKASSGARLGGPLTGIDTPTLRDAWATAPYLHDGAAATVEDAIRAHANLNLSAGDLADVAAFTRQIGGEEPAVSAPSPDPPAAGDGLTGRYFSNATLGGDPVLTRVEAVDFDWEWDAPAREIADENFSVRWTGQVAAPVSGSYTFQTVSDDGVRLWVNGSLIIDLWTDHAPTASAAAPLVLAAGQRYDIKVEYYEKSGRAVMQLAWITPGGAATTAIPRGQLYGQ